MEESTIFSSSDFYTHMVGEWFSVLSSKKHWTIYLNLVPIYLKYLLFFFPWVPKVAYNIKNSAIETSKSCSFWIQSRAVSFSRCLSSSVSVFSLASSYLFVATWLEMLRILLWTCSSVRFNVFKVVDHGYHTGWHRNFAKTLPIKTKLAAFVTKDYLYKEEWLNCLLTGVVELIGSRTCMCENLIVLYIL